MLNHSLPSFSSIGVIHSPFQSIENMPIQPKGAPGVGGTVEVFPEYAQGLKDIDGFSHIYLIYVFHQIKGQQLLVTPFLDKEPRGVFATRAPKRPNPIGLSVVRLLGVEGTTLLIENIDVLDGTPLLDIKPYVPAFDHPQERVNSGWLEKTAGNAGDIRSDNRFDK